MIDRQAADERLREAFQALGETARDKCSDEELERIWRAVSGDLPAAERRELVDRMATDPARAEAWRVAQHFWRASHDEVPSEAARPVRSFSASWTPAWLAVAAALFVVVGVGLVQLNRSPGDEFRDQGRDVVESLVPSDTSLPRNAFWLRWMPGPQGARYDVRITTEDLRVLKTVADLTVPELLVESDLLSGIAPGGRVLWQVDVALPDGERRTSQTFVARVQ